MRTFRGHRAFKESMAMVSERRVLVKLLSYWRRRRSGLKSGNVLISAQKCDILSAFFFCLFFLYLHESNNIPQFFEDHDVSPAEFDIFVVRDGHVKELGELLQLRQLLLRASDRFLSLEDTTR